MTISCDDCLWTADEGNYCVLGEPGPSKECFVPATEGETKDGEEKA